MNCRIYCATSDDSGCAEVDVNTGTGWEAVDTKERKITIMMTIFVKIFMTVRMSHTSLVFFILPPGCVIPPL